MQPVDDTHAQTTTPPGEVVTVTSTEGHVYEGALVDGLRAGAGKMTRSFGATYEGEWLDGRRHGTGRFETPEFVYEGGFQHDKKHGKGKIVWADGRIYDGDWEEDMRHGHGNFTDAAVTTRSTTSCSLRPVVLL